MTTYGIQLATNTPKIEIPVGGGRKVSILPAYRLDKSSNGSGPFGGGAIVDFQVVSLDVANGRGKFYVKIGRIALRVAITTKTCGALLLMKC
ncbi:MAG: hypothetical protein U1F26_11375 [Lysobacterales bacterium]